MILAATSVNIDVTAARVLTAVAIFTVLWRTFGWAKRIERSVKKTEQRTNGDMDRKFSDQANQLAQVEASVADLHTSVRSQGQTIAHISGQLDMLTFHYPKGDANDAAT